MTDNDRAEFEQIMTVFAEGADKEWNDLKSDFYWATLKDMSIEDFRVSAGRLARTHKFANIPMPASFLEGQEENIELRSTEAWMKLDKAWKKYGSYRSVIFDDPVIHLALHAWGGDEAWIKLNDLLEADVKWFRKDFEKLYLQYARGERFNAPPLMGILERDYIFNGRHELIEPPTIIGDENKALAWSKPKALEG